MKTKKLTLLLTAAMFLMGGRIYTKGLPTDDPGAVSYTHLTLPTSDLV